MLVSQTPEHLERVVHELEDRGHSPLALAGDVREEAVVREVVARTIEAHGQVDLLVNNAGVCTYRSVLDTTVDDWQRTLDVNLTAAFLFSKHVTPHMIESRSGMIVHIGSDAGASAYANLAAYCASKYGLRGFALAHAKEVREFGIRVSLVHPGPTDTYLNGMTPGTADKQEWLQPEDVAQAVMYMVRAPQRAWVEELYLQPQRNSY